MHGTVTNQIALPLLLLYRQHGLGVAGLARSSGEYGDPSTTWMDVGQSAAQIQRECAVQLPTPLDSMVPERESKTLEVCGDVRVVDEASSSLFFDLAFAVRCAHDCPAGARDFNRASIC